MVLYPFGRRESELQIRNEKLSTLKTILVEILPGNLAEDPDALMMGDHADPNFYNFKGGEEMMFPPMGAALTSTGRLR